MDILAHALWTNYGVRRANEIVNKKDKKIKKINIFWATFFGIFPDLFAFTIPFVIGIYSILTGVMSISSFGSRHKLIGGFNIAGNLYQYSHSLVIWALVFIIVWFFAKRPRFELFGWLLHILIDIPSHALSFYPTPFLFPISQYRFPYGIQWSNKWYMIINYSLLLIVSIYMILNRRKKWKNLIAS